MSGAYWLIMRDRTSGGATGCMPVEGLDAMQGLLHCTLDALYFSWPGILFNVFVAVTMGIMLYMQRKKKLTLYIFVTAIGLLLTGHGYLIFSYFELERLIV